MTKEELKADVKAAVARKTPQEKKESIERLYTEIGQNFAIALREAFEIAYMELKEKEKEKIISKEALEL